MQLMTQHHHHHGQYQEHHGQQSPRHQDYREFREYHHAPVTSPGPDWRTEADHYSGGANEVRNRERFDLISYYHCLDHPDAPLAIQSNLHNQQRW